ncbi:MAG: FixH family protein [Massilia sp.]
MCALLRTIFGIFLLAAAGGCSMLSPPADLDLRLTRTSEHGLYSVSMRPLVDPVDINRLHPWEIRIVDATGAGVDGVRIDFDGGMPQHGHGLPTKPRVTEALGDGKYRLDGVKFSMTGWWEMRVNMKAKGGDDQVTFNTIIEAPTQRVLAAAR